MSRPARPLSGPSGPISLGRNDDGVALIRAGSRDDALRGLGYCHARDRGLQILFVRILARGLGSRWFEASDRMLAIDRFFRRLDFLGDIDAEFAALTPSTRSAVEAYSAGVNAYFSEAGLPWELRMLGYHRGFPPWTFADIVLTGKVIGYVSLGSTQGEMERWIVECVRAGVPAEALEELFPGKLGDLDIDLLRRLKLPEPVVPEALWSVPGLPWAAASNSWVVAGSRTASGAPILSNDPHLEINRIPPVWYETALDWVDETGRSRYAIGATMPGTPGIVIGRNADLSWGVTYSYMDCIDSWVEDCRDGQYRRGDDWKPLRVREFTIERKGRPAVTELFFETEEHGTLDGDPSEPGLYLATRWSCGRGTAAGSIGAIVDVLGAATADEGRAILARLSNSAWNFVVADRAGSIGMQMSGLMPIRREGASGLLPLPGWDPANDWRGFAPFEDLPRSLDPPGGLIVAANDDLNALGIRKPISVTAVPYRAERIRQVLESHEGKFTLDDMTRLQLDLKSTQAGRFMPLIRPLLDDRRDNPRAEILRRWTLDYPVGSPGAALFERFYRALYDDVFGGRLGRAAIDHLREETILLAEFYAVFDRVLLAERSLWFAGRSRAQVYRAALDVALAEDAPAGRVTPALPFNHILFGGKLPRFLGFDRGPYELPGGRASVSQCQVIKLGGRQSVSGPSLRLVADMATDEIHTALPGGPSDRRSSPWYASELEDYLAGKTKVIRGTR
jgi:penicillin amidase